MLTSPTRRQRGHSLVEVMVAICIFSLCLLGAASMLISSTRVSANALSSSQAAVLAGYAVERMRANPEALNAGAFDAVSVNATTVVAAAGACIGAPPPCSAQALAVDDIAAWRAQLSTALAGAYGDIACVPAAGLRRCAITIRWDDSLGQREVGPSATGSIVQQRYILRADL